MSVPRSVFDEPLCTDECVAGLRWTPFDPQRNFPDLGPLFSTGEEYQAKPVSADEFGDLSWSAVLKRTFEAYLRGERPNMYGEWLQW